MIRCPALAALRVGCVKYLNARPLIYGCDASVVFDHPSGLACALAAGALDVALVPTFEALRDPRYLLADGVAIASDGPVFSVFLAHRGPLAEVRTVALDPASLTSIHLLQVLLAEYHGLRPQMVALADFPHAADAVLLIGNQAIDFRERDAGAHQILDLGAEWKSRTGLPFVYAPWLLRADLENASAVADELRALRNHGLSHLAEIIRADAHQPALAQRYLTQHIRFDLGAREKAGIEKFRELLVKHDFIPASLAALRYV